MTMIDESVLVNALHDVANTFDVSAEAPKRILGAAQATEPSERPHHVLTFLDHPSRGRTLLMAAAIVVLVAGVSVPLLRGEGNTNKEATFGPSRGVHSRQGVVIGGTPPLAATGTGSGAAPSSPPITKLGIAATPFAEKTLTTSLKIESTGSIALTVRKGRVESAFSSLEKLATSDGGFVDSTNAHVGSRTTGRFSYGTIVVQVPQRDFTKLVAQAEHVGHTTSVSTTSNDVTAQYVDLQAHVTALEASRRQYLVIMTKATTISGILAVQSQLDALQSQIEQLQGQLNVLSHETTYGTLSVTVSETGHHAHKASPLSGFAKAWHDSVKGFVAGFEWLLRLAGPALFAIIALSGAWGLGTFVRRRARRRRI
ncbi:MAG: DUF4349 domain-containing protein [Acidimicrobiales bacterium]